MFCCVGDNLIIFTKILEFSYNPAYRGTPSYRGAVCLDGGAPIRGVLLYICVYVMSILSNVDFTKST